MSVFLVGSQLQEGSACKLMQALHCKQISSGSTLYRITFSDLTAFSPPLCKQIPYRPRVSSYEMTMPMAPLSSTALRSINRTYSFTATSSIGLGREAGFISAPRPTFLQEGTLEVWVGTGHAASVACSLSERSSMDARRESRSLRVTIADCNLLNSPSTA